MQQTRETIIANAASGQQLVPADTTRLYLVISSPTGNAILVASNPGNLAPMAGGGITVGGAPPLMLSRDNVGIAVTLPWYLSTAGAFAAIYTLEVYDPANPFPIGDGAKIQPIIQGVGVDPADVSGVDRPDPTLEQTRTLQGIINRLRQLIGGQ